MKLLIEFKCFEVIFLVHLFLQHGFRKWSFDFLLTSYIHAGDWLIPKQIGSLPEQILLLAPTEIRLGKTTRSRVDCGIGARCYILQIHRSGRISTPLAESTSLQNNRSSCQLMIWVWTPSKNCVSDPCIDPDDIDQWSLMLVETWTVTKKKCQWP